MLSAQIASGGGGVSKSITTMTAGERALNQEKLRAIHSNPELMETLVNRIKFGSSPKKVRSPLENDDEL